ncbi:hypothetical protein, partial [Lysobacter sp. TAB13]|uniref:hypothetical protein n=1 Tax=Lysobacter sp. TAB13 TaxID=3233065 RepID=UPI003F969494
EQTYVISKVTSNSANIVGITKQGTGGGPARRDGNQLTFGTKVIRTLTINGNTAIVTGRNVENGETLKGTLTKH